MRIALLFLALATTAHAQWTMQDSHTTASLRGIHNVGGGVAWASGTNGTVLRTEDGGYLWQTCTVPPGAEKLDFRGIQAFDANTAIVMSSGKGDLSRLYKTTDGCNTWKLVFTNPDKDGFWDVLLVNQPDYVQIFILGDPVGGQFAFWSYIDGPKEKWHRVHTPPNIEGESIFAASNSAMIAPYDDATSFFATGGSQGSRFFVNQDSCGNGVDYWIVHPLPMFPKGSSSGVFSLALADSPSSIDMCPRLVAVGGDYLKPNDSTGTAAFTTDGGKKWSAPTTPPHGYRSAVAYEEKSKTWITVGPNGTDVSTDDGRNWRALHPGPQDAPDADRNWNALSLPYVVGPNGRIGKLNPESLPPH